VDINSALEASRKNIKISFQGFASCCMYKLGVWNAVFTAIFNRLLIAAVGLADLGGDTRLLYRNLSGESRSVDSESVEFWKKLPSVVRN
jgi:hypothetical protein